MKWQLLVESQQYPIYEIEYLDALERAVFFYLEVPKKDIIRFEKAIDSDLTFDLQDYGTVLKKGFGKPTEEMRTKLLNNSHSTSEE